MQTAASNKPLTLLRLVMINIIAVDSLRNISITAQAGWVVVSFYLLAAIVFLVPCALLTAEMATGHSKTGGIYLWTKEAFGVKPGFIILWLQWLYNLVWFPSICGFFAGIIAYVIAPAFHTNPTVFVNNPWYMITLSLVMFWSATLINLRGIKLSSTVSIIGAVVGTLLPMVLIIGLALFWFGAGLPVANAPHLADFVPNMDNFQSWGLFLTVMFSLFGLEMSAIHADNVDQPKRNFPKALLISGAVILLTLILSNIAVFSINSSHTNHVDIVTGLMISFNIFFQHFGASWLTILIALTLIIGAFTTISAWIMGLSRAFLVAGEDGLLPKTLCQKNKHQAPTKILLVQGVIFSIFCLAYLVMPSVHSAYWFLSDLTAQLAVIAYIGMFLAAVKLRLNVPTKPGQFTIGRHPIGTVLVAFLGCFGCLIAMIVGFIPTQDTLMPTWRFDTLLGLGLVIALIIPQLILRYAPQRCQ